MYFGVGRDGDMALMVLAALVLYIEVTPSRRDEAYIHQATTTHRLGSISATLSDEHLPKLAAVPGHKPTAPIVGDLWGRRTLSPALRLPYSPQSTQIDVPTVSLGLLPWVKTHGDRGDPKYSPRNHLWGWRQMTTNDGNETGEERNSLNRRLRLCVTVSRSEGPCRNNLLMRVTKRLLTRTI